jgi:DNA repair protein RadC
MEQLLLFKHGKRKRLQPQEWKIVALRECPVPEKMHLCDKPQRAVDYWNLHIKTAHPFDPERECFVVLFLNTRRRIRGHQFLSIGTMDTILVHPREVFRMAVLAGASAIVLMHNHPSGDPQPSEADIKVTRDLILAGQLLKIEVLDHLIIGRQKYQSLRESGTSIRQESSIFLRLLDFLICKQKKTKPTYELAF